MLDNKTDSARYICSCASSEHQICFFSDDDPKIPEIYLEVRLNEYYFFKRLKIAFKYIFGYKSKYGSFDTFIFDNRDIEELYGYLRNKIRKDKLKNI